jgi:hypothetical protein
MATQETNTLMEPASTHSSRMTEDAPLKPIRRLQ